MLLSILLALFLPPLETAPVDLFDFWVGEWDLTWEDAQGQTHRGYNRVLKILDETVIQENFTTFPSTGNTLNLKGMSLSVYNPQTQRWHQAWADNQGGYYNFVGQFEGDKRMFVTKTTNQRGKEIIQRMVFRNISEESFVWDWESSTDGGETWQLNWQIHYQRKK